MSTLDHEAFFIDGSWRRAEGADHFDVISPRSEQRIGRVPAASRADIDAAVAAARKAFDEGEWPRLAPAERADYLTRLADGLGKRQAELAELITEELGCPLFLSQVYQAVAPIMSFNYAAEVGRSLQTAEVRVSDLSPLAASSAGGSIIPMAGASLVVKEPVGVVASFPAYNFALRRDRAEGWAGAGRGLHGRREGHRTQPPGDLRRRRDLRGDRPAAGRAEHRGRTGPGIRVPRAPPRCGHGQFHGFARRRRQDRRSLW